MKLTCKFCDKTFTVNKALFHLNNKCSLSGPNRLYDFCSFVYTTDITDTVIDKYIEGYSIDELKQYGFSRRMLTELLHERGIEVRTISNASKTAVRQQKYTNTCIKRYGVSNISQDSNIKMKKANTFMLHYGVDNVRKCSDFRDNHGYNDTMISKYGTRSLSNRYGNLNKWWDTISSEERYNKCSRAWKANSIKWQSLSDVEKQIIIEKRLNTFIKNNPNGLPNYISKLETRISNLLFTHNIWYKPQTWINRRSYDFMFKGKVILEVQGDYWHANPLLYEASDVIKYPKNKQLTASDIWDKDKLKKENAESYAYTLYTIWESELNNMSDNDLLLFIKSIIGTTSDE